MECPYCGKMMTRGYIRQTHMPGIHWYSDRRVPGKLPFIQKRESIKLTSLFNTGGEVPTYRCEDCGKLIINEKEIYA